ncbi:MAG: FliM/FliN family flagellar motor C-terminal domain-containing protein [Aestuariivirga sp.]
MSQSTKAAWESAVSITADHINASGGISKDRKEFREFLDRLRDAARAAIEVLKPAVIQSRIAAVNTVSKSWDEPSKNLDWFTSGSQQLHVWLFGNRRLNRLLCELAYGGTEKSAPEGEIDPPPIKIEERLANHIFKLVSENLAKFLSEDCEVNLERVGTFDPEALEQFATPQRLLEVRLVVEILQNDCEITAYFVADEIKDLLLENAHARQDLSPFNSVKKCKFELLSLLPPDEVSLGAVLALKPGSQLSLSISVETPIMVVCGGETVFEGECDPSGDKINIHLRAREESGFAPGSESAAA